MINKNITRPALRYFGGKFRLAPWIISQFPPHTVYVEPFGGGGSVLLRKLPAYHEVYNDLDGDVVNFFRVLREQPDELLRAIDLTPYSREEQRQAFDANDEPSSLDRARLLYVRAWQSYGGGRTQWHTGWRYEIGSTRGKRVVEDWNSIDHLNAIATRLKTVQIERDHALNVIHRFDSPSTLFYCDPPYLESTRSPRWHKKAYQHELTDEQHEELLGVLKSVNGMVIISGHPSELYDDLLAGWKKMSKTVPTDFQSVSVECLWISPRAANNHGQQAML